MATLTLTDLLAESLTALGRLEAGGAANLTPQQKNNALVTANQLIDSKSSDRLMAASAVVSSFGVVSGTQSYVIGTAQTWNLARPTEIVSASIKLANGYTRKIKIVNAVEWSSLEDRDRQSYQVTHLFYNRGGPTQGTVYLSPVPFGGNVEITSWAAMTQFADVTTPITMQPAYSRWLVLAFAIEIAPQYPSAQVTPTLLEDYADAVATLRNQNASLFGNAPPAGQIASNTTPPASIAPAASEAA